MPWSDRWTPLFDDVVLDHYRDVVGFAWSRKLIRKQLAPEELVEPRFVRAALKELALEQRWKPWTRG